MGISVPGMYTPQLSEFLIALGMADELETGFEHLATLVSAQGFDAVVYSAMPASLGAPGLIQPVFLASSEFSKGFLSHYAEADLWQHDFTIDRIRQGFVGPLDWGKELKESKMSEAQQQVVRLANSDYGITNAISIPTQSDPHIIAGASVTSCESRSVFDSLLESQLTTVQFAIHRFHQFVFSKTSNTYCFYEPLIEELSAAEKRVVAFVALGKPLKQSKHYTNLSPTRCSNVLSNLYRRMSVSNASELCFLVGHHKLVEML